MRSQGFTVSKVPRDNLCKNTEKQLFKKCIMYTYNQQPKGNNRARQTRTQYLNSNIPNHSYWGKKCKTVFFHFLYTHARLG